MLLHKIKIFSKFIRIGGVACALGGAALGATGLAGPPTSHLTAALLMIGEMIFLNIFSSVQIVNG